MNTIKAYKVGWQKVWKNKKMWILLYILNFAFALLATIPFSGFLNESLGSTLMTSSMLNGFDYTFLSDFMREFGGGINVILNLSFGIIGLYFLFSIFWMGGILTILKDKNTVFSFQTFWRGGAYNFWRLLRLTFYFLFIHIIIIGIFVFIFLRNGLSPFEMESEVGVIHSIMILAPIYLIISTIFFMIQDYAKIHVIHRDTTWLTPPFQETFKIIWRNFGKYFLLYLLNVGTFLLFFGVYWLLSNSFNSTTTSTIILLFFIGQAFIFARIAVKLLNLGSATVLYQNLENPFDGPHIA